MNINIKDVLSYIPKRFHNVILIYSNDNLQEIRFRKNKPICMLVNSKNIVVKQSFISEEDIELIFENICEHSVYAYQNEINNGFVTTKSGNRVGVCGTAVTENGKMVSVKDISSVNFRIAHDFYGCADKILDYCKESFIICGPPASGKTTLLRDISRQLSNQNKKVCVVDERFEISGVSEEFDLGIMTDVLKGYDKAFGALLALRTLSPEIIIFDEIGALNECESVFECLNSGVCIITTVHCSSEKDFLNRSICQKLIKSQAFKNVVFLGDKAGEINRICKLTGEGLCDLAEY